MGSYLFFLLILACPLMMIWMMRGMHGGHGGSADGGPAHGGSGHDPADSGPDSSLEQLHRRREQLDHEIEEREAEQEAPAPIGGGWR
jgi:hypothetical protein